MKWELCRDRIFFLAKRSAELFMPARIERKHIMPGSKKLSLGVILASATLTVMAGSILAPVLNLMRDALSVTPSSVGLIITTHGLFMALFSH